MIIYLYGDPCYLTRPPCDDPALAKQRALLDYFDRDLESFSIKIITKQTLKFIASFNHTASIAKSSMNFASAEESMGSFPPKE